MCLPLDLPSEHRVPKLKEGHTVEEELESKEAFSNENAYAKHDIELDDIDHEEILQKRLITDEESEAKLKARCHQHPTWSDSDIKKCLKLATEGLEYTPTIIIDNHSPFQVETNEGDENQAEGTLEWHLSDVTEIPSFGGLIYTATATKFL